MSRLLFAAARGARVQRNLVGMADVWTGAVELPADERDFAYQFRIHPDDEHLQYGPISAVLRVAATDPLPSIGALGYPGQYKVSVAVTDGIGWHNTRDYIEVDDFHRSLFLLILAEALADEGL